MKISFTGPLYMLGGAQPIVMPLRGRNFYETKNGGTVFSSVHSAFLHPVQSLNSLRKKPFFFSVSPALIPGSRPMRSASVSSTMV